MAEAVYICANKTCTNEVLMKGMFCEKHHFAIDPPKVVLAREEFQIGKQPEIDVAVAAPITSDRFQAFIGQEDRRKNHAEMSVSQRYPKYYKDVRTINELDVYQVHRLFDIKDPSGAIQHASKKLLLSGVRTGNKNFFKDIEEARDALNRWLEMNDHRKAE